MTKSTDNLVAAASSIAEVASGMEELRGDVGDNAGAAGEVTNAAFEVRDRASVLRGAFEHFTHATDEATDWRSHRRFDLDAQVTITAAGMAPQTARMRNLSRGGAALSYYGPLPQNRMCSLEGLLPMPVTARVVDLRDGVLRIQFSRDEDAQAQIGKFIDEQLKPHLAA